MTKTYPYVGPPEIAARAAGRCAGTAVTCAAEVQTWLRDSRQAVERGRTVAATFVVDPQGRLLIADRHDEHVACAGGGHVLSAGEMFFDFGSDGEAGSVRVAEVSNQSTGYCPEPESWPAVGRALDRAGIPHPGGFTAACVFRRCEACGSRNIVKDDWYFCDVCGATLPAEWNFG
jgi:hypothetical protein